MTWNFVDYFRLKVPETIILEQELSQKNVVMKLLLQKNLATLFFLIHQAIKKVSLCSFSFSLSLSLIPLQYGLFRVAEVELIVCNLKRKATDHPEQRPSQIKRTDLAAVSGAVLNRLLKRQNLAKSKWVSRHYDLPSNPKSIKDIKEAPKPFVNTLLGDRFLIHDVTDDNGRLFVFETKRNIK